MEVQEGVFDGRKLAGKWKKCDSTIIAKCYNRAGFLSCEGVFKLQGMLLG